MDGIVKMIALVEQESGEVVEGQGGGGGGGVQDLSGEKACAMFLEKICASMHLCYVKHNEIYTSTFHK